MTRDEFIKWLLDNVPPGAVVFVPRVTCKETEQECTFAKFSVEDAITTHGGQKLFLGSC